MSLHRSGSSASARCPSLAVNPLHHPAAGEVPRDALPAASMDPRAAQRIVQDELLLDGNARLNLATFVTTWMEPEARELMASVFDKNMIDKDEYPQTAELEARCVAMLGRLWNAPARDGEAPADATATTGATTAVGCSTTGSSEAAMLAGLALKRRWEARRRAAGEPTDRPNIVMGANVQVCWEKFARYWDVEPRLVPMEGERFHLDAPTAVERCDERTIGVVGILGSTFDGSYEPIAEIAAALDDLQARTGLDVPLHVDAASGGFVAPFLDEELVWDFRLPRVASINASGHKYGLVYPGVGWALWREPALLPEELVFHVSYLGGDMPTFALNFSRPGAQVVAQYFQFLRLGMDGYRRVQQGSRDTAMRLADGLEATGAFRPLTRGDELPVFAVTLADDVDAFSVYDVSATLRERGWLVPAYPFVEARDDLHVLRVVVRNGFSDDLADLLLADVRRALARLARQPAPLRGAEHADFSHGAHRQAGTRRRD
ncbi:glutamate decarboxylase [Patulibacter brassicae]|uniref:Glutamate decarboxylase n=1 Tax=Patulibacter brassicae TaxID=1705717 RepID=A0ABU4VFU1_9ACTN|nr:glutamate decarboxylase [Patulibacter brassicae]MDX8150669.1 glutamate decarboxylase [Patulibacter brassicae]